MTGLLTLAVTEEAESKGNGTATTSRSVGRHGMTTVVVKPGAKDIVQTAKGTGSFKSLVAAVQAAGLVDTLKGEGPLTVFAPTDEAFTTLPMGTAASLLSPENKEKLVAILTYRVEPGKVMAADVVKIKSSVTVQSQQIDVAVQDGKVSVDGGNVVKKDIVCSNGVIHVIDSEILPADTGVMVDAAKVVDTDIEASHGVVHVTDGVILA